MASVNCIIGGDAVCGREIARAINNPEALQVILEGMGKSLVITDLSETPVEYDALRKATLQDCSICVFCFDVGDVRSFQFVKEQWLPELRGCCDAVPLILLATRTEVREERRKRNLSFISQEEGLKLSAEIGAVTYIECSIKKDEGVKILPLTILKEYTANEKQKATPKSSRRSINLSIITTRSNSFGSSNHKSGSPKMSLMQNGHSNTSSPSSNASFNEESPSSTRQKSMFSNIWRKMTDKSTNSSTQVDSFYDTDFDSSSTNNTCDNDTMANRNDPYVIERRIGSGGQGHVFLASKKGSKNDGKKFAIKKVEVSSIEEANLAMVEVKSLIRLRHDNIVTYVDFYFEQTPGYSDSFRVCLVMELCEGNDLYGEIKAHKSNGKKSHFSEQVIRDWIRQICKTLDYIHSCDVIHRDLKPQNIFLTANKQIKLGDFGLAKSIEEKSFAITKCGTQEYMSPEVSNGEKYTNKIDMWAVGCILLDLMTLEQRDVKMEILKNSNFLNDIEAEVAKQYSDKLCQIMKRCLQLDPQRRPEATEILSLLN